MGEFNSNMSCFSTAFQNTEQPALLSENTIRTWVNNLKQTVLQLKKKRWECKNSSNLWKHRTCSTGNAKKFTSIDHTSCSTSYISDRSVGRIFHQYLQFHPYKIQIMQSLNTGDYQRWIRFCEDMLRRLEYNDDQVNNLWMSN